MDVDEAPRRFLYSKYWGLREEDKFALHEEVMPPQICQNIRKIYAEAAFNSRNREIWRRCKQLGLGAGDIQDCFGGDLDNIRRSLRDGKTPPQHLWLAGILAGLDQSQATLIPKLPDKLKGFAKTVEMLHHHCLATANALTSSPLNPGMHLPTAAARLDAWPLDSLPAALMWNLCSSETKLNQWLTLSVPVANDFCLMVNSPMLQKFLASLIADTKETLPIDDHDSLNILTSWQKEDILPETVLVEIARVWNPLQLHCHFVRDELSF